MALATRISLIGDSRDVQPILWDPAFLYADGPQCSQCHGSGAAGAVGYPNLLDNDWLWGGSMEAIILTVRHGVRNDTDDDAHYSEMPAFADLLEKEEIAATIEYVLSLSKQEHDQTLGPIGAELFADNCSSWSSPKIAVNSLGGAVTCRSWI